MANEAVAAPVHRLDKARHPGVITQRLAQLAHADGQRHLAHRRLRPEGLEQSRFGEQLARVFHQIPEEGEGFRPQDPRLVAAPQAFVGQIEPHRHGGGGGLW